MTQHYGNHPHRPTQYGIAFLLMLAAAASHIVGAFGWRTNPVTLAFIIIALMWLAFAARRGTTRLQDRVIKLEMRYRTDKLLSADQSTALWKLTNRQIIALRFASDAELPGLIERASREQLSGQDIKKSIVSWVPDWDRT